MTNNDDKYTDPELRSEIKEKVQAEDKGGKPGQWSARKAQLMASEYKKAAHEQGFEPYTTDKADQDDRQKHLNEWTKEDWQTSDGNGNATQENGEMRRYLPKKAWENMTDEEKKETDEKKLKGSKNDEQHVPNTDAAKNARKAAQGHTKEDEGSELKDQGDNEEDYVPSDGSLFLSDKEEEAPKKQSKNSCDKRETKRGVKHQRSNEEDDDENDELDSENEHAAQKPKTKRTKTDAGKKTRAGAQKAKHGKEGTPGKQASASRLPKEGQNVHSQANEGEAIEVGETDQ